MSCEPEIKILTDTVDVLINLKVVSEFSLDMHKMYCKDTQFSGFTNSDLFFRPSWEFEISKHTKKTHININNTKIVVHKR